MTMLLSIAFLILPVSLWAGGETAAFLKLAGSPRAAGMGGAYTAITGNVASLSLNPAGLSGLVRREFGAAHADLPAQTRYDFIGYAHPAQFGVFGVGVGYLSHGSIDERDAAGRPAGRFSASDASVNLGYAQKVSYSACLGINLKFIKSSIADVSARTFAIDIGSKFNLAKSGPGIPQIGLAIQNLGPGMKFARETDFLPLTLAAGVGYQLPAGLILAADLRHRPYSKDSEVSIGTEYAAFSGLSIRAGYGASKEPAKSSSGLSAPAGFAAGFGAKAFGYELDYSMAPFGELGNSQRVSLGARF